ncbi:MAG: alcohol dehydrogenase catalytic domain-containing protein [Thermodesulfobacteriota bacterium]
MKAAVLHACGQPLELLDTTLPDIQEDEVLLQVEACGVCHSDLHIVEGDLPGFNAMMKLPIIPGHEVVGRIVRKGSAVDRFQIGERAGVAWMYSSCGTCDPCQENRENLCRKGVVTGLMVNGGYAELMVAKASHATPIPDNLSSVEAAPLFCAGVTVYRALTQAGMASGQRVAVFGIGGLGHLAVQMAASAGAEVIAVDVSDEKLALARSLGASLAIDARDRQAMQSIRKTGGAHIAAVTTASKAAYDSAIRCLRHAGTLCVIGLPSEPLSFHATMLVGSEMRILGSSVGTRADIRAVLDLAAAGKLRCQTETASLSDINDILENMRKGAITGRIVLKIQN